MHANNLLEEKDNHLRRSESLTIRDEMSHFSQPINHHKNKIKTRAIFGKGGIKSIEIDSHLLKGWVGIG